MPRPPAIRPMAIALFAICVGAPTVFAGMRSRVEPGVFAPLSAPLRDGVSLRISKLPLNERNETIVLEEFDVLAPGAVVEIFAVNALRYLNAGQIPFGFTDPTLNSTIAPKALHVTQLRAELNAVRLAIGFSSITFTTDPTITATSTSIKKAHIDELRAGVQ